MKIAVIGSGNIGKALGGSLIRAGYEVTLASRSAEHARTTAAGIGAQATDSIIDAVSAAEVIVLAVPAGHAVDVAREIAPATAGKVVIDVTNPLKSDLSGLSTTGVSVAEELAQALPEAALVKGFNTLFGSLQADPTTHGQTIDALFATDDEQARATFTALATDLGFRAVHVGALAAARELEAMALLNIRLQVVSGGAWQSTFVLVGAPESVTVEPARAAA